MTTPTAAASSWRINLLVLWFAQLATMVGFSFIHPFLPLFLQEDLGVSNPENAALWSGFAGAAMGVAMVVSGPVWGVLGDRYGRKNNIMRAMFASALLVGFTGFATNAYQLIGIRFMTGLITGVFSTVMALTAANTPREKIGYAMGLLQSSILVGMILGPVFGGFVSEALGFRATFMVGGCLAAIGGFLVLFLVREEFQRPPVQTKGSVFGPFREFWTIATSPTVLPILGVIFLIHISVTMSHPVLPVLLKELSGISDGAASLAGVAFGVMGIAGAVSALGNGFLSQRVSVKWLLVLGCLGASLFYAPAFALSSILGVIAMLSLAALFHGGLPGLAVSMVGLVVPKHRHSTAYGAVQSFSSMAFGLGPLVGGILATGAGLQSVFLAQAGAFLLTAFIVGRLVGESDGAADPDKGESFEVKTTGQF